MTSTSAAPLVSVVTPVYNGAEFLPECIESILHQTYEHWDFTIVNNCSTDDTLTVCLKYARRDPRIRVVTNSSFLNIIENHNRALTYISPDAKYGKVLFGDDWLFPTCLEQLVSNAERHPSIGVVSSYALAGDRILCAGVPFPSHVVDGREICRRKLAGGVDVFGTPTTQLVRADLIRKRTKFFNEANLHADTEACLDVLQESDFGFVHQILSCSRQRADSNESFAKKFETHMLGMLVAYMKYGPVYLDRGAYKYYLKKRLKDYHCMLAKNVLCGRSMAFWRFHAEALRSVGGKIEPLRVIASLPHEAFKVMRGSASRMADVNPWWPEAISRFFDRASSEVRFPLDNSRKSRAGSGGANG